MKKLVAVIVILCLIIMTGTEQGKAYSSSGAKSKVNKVAIRGIVKDINLGKDGANLIVEGKLEADTIYDKASVHINIHTIIQMDNLKRLYRMTDIKLGDTVEVVFSGSVSGENPVRGTAHSVKILTHPAASLSSYAVTAAYLSLSREQQRTVIDLKAATLDEFTAAENSTISYKNSVRNISGIRVKTVTFDTNNSKLIGPIVVYMNSKSLAVLGYGFRR